MQTTQEEFTGQKFGNIPLGAGMEAAKKSLAICCRLGSILPKKKLGSKGGMDQAYCQKNAHVKIGLAKITYVQFRAKNWGLLSQKFRGAHRPF